MDATDSFKIRDLFSSSSSSSSISPSSALEVLEKRGEASVNHIHL